jgi:NAD(P)-dependent dehydrogenase (short-subunit alcohol dehydrogenase family)
MARRRRPFAGAAAVVTGGASGIGAAFDAELLGAGAHVVLVDVDGAALDATVERLLPPDGASVEARCADVRDPEAVRAVVDETVAGHGAIDVLVNNAGISMGGPTHEMSAAHWDRIIDVNLRGVVNGLLAAYPAMVAQGHGHVLNTASGAGLVAPPLVVGYATTKHAVVGLTTALRPEAARHGVRVSVLCPGSVETPILDRAPDADLPPTASAPVTARRYLELLRQRPVPADRVARAALRGLARNRGIIVVPRSAKVPWYLDRLSPALTERLVMRPMTGRVVDRLVRPAGDASD